MKPGEIGENLKIFGAVLIIINLLDTTASYQPIIENKSIYILCYMNTLLLLKMKLFEFELNFKISLFKFNNSRPRENAD